MLLQDFDPQVLTANDFVQFCERLETMEKEDKLPRESYINNTKRNRFSKETRKLKSFSKGKRKGLDCLLHGKDCGHTSDQCFVLKKQADKLKATTRTSNKDTNYADLHATINAAI